MLLFLSPHAPAKWCTRRGGAGCSRAPLISQAHYLAGNRVTKTNCTVAKGEEARAGGDSPSSCGDTPDKPGRGWGFAFWSHVLGILERHAGPLNRLQEAAELGQGPAPGLSGASVLGLPHGALRHGEMERGVCVTATRWKQADAKERKLKEGILQSSERVLSHAVLRCPRLTLRVPTGLPRRPGG